MASVLIGIQVPGNRLRVRVPCPPLFKSFDANDSRSSISAAFGRLISLLGRRFQDAVLGNPIETGFELTWEFVSQ